MLTCVLTSKLVRNQVLQIETLNVIFMRSGKLLPHSSYCCCGGDGRTDPVINTLVEEGE